MVECRISGGAVLKPNPLFEEFLAATVAIVTLLAFISTLYWLFTGASPWPDLILGQALIYGTGIGVLTLTSPRRRS